MRFADGSSFAGYEIVSRLGRGGMATVYLAREPGLDRLVALKVLPEHLVDERDFAARFEHEARMIAALDHPNVLPLYRYGISDGIPWMALRYVAGGDLAQRLAKGAVESAEGLAILRGVASALDYAHKKGVIHRDLKPQNILIAEYGSAYLADFGVAKLLEGSDHLRTASGSIFGTPLYMAPEQALGNTVGAHTDIYALAVICFQWLTGIVPFSADTPHAVLIKQVNDPPPQDILNRLSPRIAEVLVRGLAKAPADRYPSAAALVDNLESALREQGTAVAAAGTISQSPPARRPLRSAAFLWIAVTMIVVLSLLGWVVSRRLAQPALPETALSDGAHVPRSVTTEPAPVAMTVPEAARPAVTAAPRNAVAEAPPKPVVHAAPQAPASAHKENVTAAVEKPARHGAAIVEAKVSTTARFSVLANNVLADGQARVDWTQTDNGSETFWNNAAGHCTQQGSGWRLPTENELAGLYGTAPNQGAARCGVLTCNVTTLFHLTAASFWSGTRVGDGTQAWTVNLHNGSRHAESIANSTSNRVLCVRAAAR